MNLMPVQPPLLLTKNTHVKLEKNFKLHKTHKIESIIVELLTF